MRTLLIIIVASICLFAFKEASVSDDFKIKIEIFLKKYDNDYSNSGETLRPSNGYQRTLDATKYSWIKKQTLKSKKSFINQYNQVAYQRLFFAFYVYQDEQAAKTAWNHLVNCFPLMCDSLTVGKNVSMIKTYPAVYIFSNSEIITCHVYCEQVFDTWKGIQEDIIKNFSDSLSTIITTGCLGPLEWKQIGK